MKVGIVPTGAKSINDVLWIDDLVALMGKLARKHGSAFMLAIRRLTKNPKCADCGSTQFLEVHHIKPVWVYSIEAILKEQPKTYKEAGMIVEKYWRKNGKQLECHTLSNLKWLCEKCHDKLHVEVDRQWKTHFEINHRIVFQSRNLELIDRLLET